MRSLLDQPNFALLGAAEQGAMPNVVSSIADGADVNHARHDGLTACLLAAQAGHCYIVKYCIEEHRVDVNHTAPGGMTACLLAAQAGHLEIAHLLIDRYDVDVNHATNGGETACLLAAQAGHFDMVKYLIKEKGADANHTAPGGMTACLIAAEKGHLDIVKYCIETQAFDVNRVMYFIERKMLLEIMDEFLYTIIHSSIDAVKQRGLCFLMRRTAVDLPRGRIFSGPRDFIDALCDKSELLKTQKQELTDDMIQFVFDCYRVNQPDYCRAICDKISAGLQSREPGHPLPDDSFHQHFAPLLDDANGGQLTYQGIYRLCLSYISACHAGAHTPDHRAWMLFYSAEELARELTLRLRVKPGSCIGQSDVGTVVSLKIAEYVGIQDKSRASGEHYFFTWVPKNGLERLRSHNASATARGQKGPGMGCVTA